MVSTPVNKVFPLVIDIGDSFWALQQGIGAFLSDELPTLSPEPTCGVDQILAPNFVRRPYRVLGLTPWVCLSVHLYDNWSFGRQNFVLLMDPSHWLRLEQKPL